MAIDLHISKPKNYRFVWILLILVGILAKIGLLHVKTGDFNCFLEPWISFIKTHGYFSALKFNFYDYTPTYIYILILIAKTGLNPLFLVKFVSIFFEYVAAFFIGKIAGLKENSNKFVLIALAVIPILPSVLLNSSYLSQCDSIYASFVIGSIYFLLKNKQLPSVILLGIAFSLKMQTAFILPFFFVYMLRGKIRWYYFLTIPAIFFISILPTLFYGRDLSDLFNVYASQANRYPFLTLNFPNIYSLISNDYYEPVKLAGVLATVVITLISGLLLSNKKYVFSFDQWIKLAFISAIVVPFVLPGMHERYMYLGDLLGILYFLVIRKNIHFPIGIALISFYSYIRCSRFNDILPMAPAFIVYLVIIILVLVDFIISLKNESSENHL